MHVQTVLVLAAVYLCFCVTAVAVPPVPAAIGEDQAFFIDCNGTRGAGGRRVNLFDYDVVVVGAGLSGAVLAQQHAEHLRKRVLVLERRNHSAGNTYDYINDLGIRVSQYGPHLFHTRSERVWRYVQRFARWTRYDHRVVGLVDKQLVPIPVNLVTVNTLLNESLRSGEDMQAWLARHQIPMRNSTEGAAATAAATTTSAGASAAAGAVTVVTAGEAGSRLHSGASWSSRSSTSSSNATGEAAAKARVGEVLFDKVFREYTRKQWAREAAWLAPEVLQRIPVHAGLEDRYFAADPHQGLPAGGYTDAVRRMLLQPGPAGPAAGSSGGEPLVDVCLQVDFFEAVPDDVRLRWLAATPTAGAWSPRDEGNGGGNSGVGGDSSSRGGGRGGGGDSGVGARRVLLQEQQQQQQRRRIFFTGPVDRFFEASGLPRLEYRSIRFEVVDLPDCPVFQPAAVVNYPQDVDGAFTRIVEYKHFDWLDHTQRAQGATGAGGGGGRVQGTTIVREFSTDDGEPYYPVPDQRNQRLYEQYRRLAQAEEAAGGVFFVGRLANYKYLNMDEAILNALRVFDRVYPGVSLSGSSSLSGGGDGTATITTAAVDDNLDGCESSGGCCVCCVSSGGVCDSAGARAENGRAAAHVPAPPVEVAVVTALPAGAQGVAWLRHVALAWCSATAAAHDVSRAAVQVRFVVYTPPGDGGEGDSSTHASSSGDGIAALRATLHDKFGAERCTVLSASLGGLLSPPPLPPPPHAAPRSPRPSSVWLHHQAALRFAVSASGGGFGHANVFLRPGTAAAGLGGGGAAAGSLAHAAARLAHAAGDSDPREPRCRQALGENATAFLVDVLGLRATATATTTTAAAAAAASPSSHEASDAQFYADSGGEAAAVRTRADPEPTRVGKAGALVPPSVVALSEPCLRHVLAVHLTQLARLAGLPSVASVPQSAHPTPS